MPQGMSRERENLLRLYGARVDITESLGGMNEAVDAALAMAADNPDAWRPDQFSNPANPEIHRRTTAEEIWRDLDGDVDVLVAGVGTGGTITGVGEVLKSRRPSCRVVAVEPAAAAVLSGRSAGAHHIPGLGAGFIPDILNRAVIDEVIPVTEEHAVKAQLELAHREGIAAGISSGAALAAALSIAARPDSKGKRMVVVLPDGGERYAGSPVFNEILRAVGARR
jgi:cysteine synthase A